MTLVSLKLDTQLKIIEFRTDKTNVKQAFLSDEKGEHFPWTFNEIISQNETCSKKACIKSDESKDEKSELAENESYENYHYEFLEEILENLHPIDNNFDHEEGQTINLNSNLYDYLFILFGSSESEINSIVVENLSKFWEKFHSKHKFIVVYINFDETSLTAFPPWYSILTQKMKVSF